MKKLAVVAIAVAGLLSASAAQAALIGHQANASGLLPDIFVDVSGEIVADPISGGKVDLSFVNSLDAQIQLVDLSIVGLFGATAGLDGGPLNIDFVLDWTVDSSGNLISGTMSEIVRDDGDGTPNEDKVKIGTQTFKEGEILLTGDVVAFGFDEGFGVPFYDFTVKLNLADSKLHESHGGVWTADVAWIFGNATLKSGTIWDFTTGAFVYDKVKTDKVVPAPGAALLAGIGLMMSRRIRRRKTA